jgi:hypothetical protein
LACRAESVGARGWPNSRRDKSSPRLERFLHLRTLPN